MALFDIDFLVAGIMAVVIALTSFMLVLLTFRQRHADYNVRDLRERVVKERDYSMDEMKMLSEKLDQLTRYLTALEERNIVIAQPQKTRIGERLSESSKLGPEERILNYENKIKYIGTVTSDMAHTLKTPLSGIKGSLRLLKEEMGNQSLDRIKELEEAIDTLGITIEGYSKLGLSTLESPKKESVNLKEAVESNFKIFALSTEKKVNLKFYIPEDIYMSSTLFKNLMIPLISILENAIEAIRDNGIIDVSVESNHSWKINIYDNGPSIPESNDKIYQRGYSTKNSEGIGLAVAKEIVEQILNGKLYHKNEPAGGVTFTVEIQKPEYGK